MATFALIAPIIIPMIASTPPLTKAAAIGTLIGFGVGVLLIVLAWLRAK